MFTEMPKVLESASEENLFSLCAQCWDQHTKTVKMTFFNCKIKGMKSICTHSRSSM